MNDDEIRTLVEDLGLKIINRRKPKKMQIQLSRAETMKAVEAHLRTLFAGNIVLDFSNMDFTNARSEDAAMVTVDIETSTAPNTPAVKPAVKEEEPTVEKPATEVLTDPTPPEPSKPKRVPNSGLDVDMPPSGTPVADLTVKHTPEPVVDVTITQTPELEPEDPVAISIGEDADDGAPWDEPENTETPDGEEEPTGLWEVVEGVSEEEEVKPVEPTPDFEAEMIQDTEVEETHNKPEPATLDFDANEPELPPTAPPQINFEDEGDLISFK